MANWLVALPAWGARYVDVAARSTLPALAIALRELRQSARIMLWTDQSDRLRKIASELGLPAIETYAVPGPDGGFESLSNCHRQTLAAARGSDRVLLLTADIVLSREILQSCESKLAAGARLICCCAMRATEGNCPIGASGRELLAWAWAHRHPMTRDCTWPDGCSYDVWRMYFANGEDVVARVFLPHPLACIPGGRQLAFHPTIDVNLAANFELRHTHVITRPEEGAAIELSPPEKEYLKTTTMRERFDSGGPSNPQFIPHTNARHRMFFSQRIVICGTGANCDDHIVANRVLGQGG